MYQESLMAYLNWLGIEMKETYDVIKKISKKKFAPADLEDLRVRCKEQWLKNVGNVDKFDETWKVMNDAVSYAFNSAHSYCVGNDGAEIAYTKAYYPYETYEVCLNWFDRKKNKDKVASLKEEMKLAFGIEIGKLKFGLDNRQFTLDKEHHCINPSLTSIKSMGKNVADELYQLSQTKKYYNFYELLIDISNNTSVNKSMLEILIKLDYFKDFGNAQKLLDFVDYYNILQDKKAPKKSTIAEKILDKNIINLIEKNSVPTEATYTKFDCLYCLKDIWDYLPNETIDFKTNLINRKDILGYIDYKNDKLNKRYVVVSDVNTKYTPIVRCYHFKTGQENKYKIYKKSFKANPLKKGNIIKIYETKEKEKVKPGEKEGEWIPTGEMEIVINKYSLIGKDD
jgi:DNA polymerase III alpha subunit